jgi:hypothetical protein
VVTPIADDPCAVSFQRRLDAASTKVMPSRIRCADAAMSNAYCPDVPRMTPEP